MGSIFSGVLNAILCWIIAIANMVAWAIMTSLNNIMITIGLLVGAAVNALPDMPTPPDWSGVSAQVFEYANWAFPLGFLVTMIASLATLFLAWQGIKILLNFAKAV